MKFKKNLRDFIYDKYGLHFNIYSEFLSVKQYYDKDFALICKLDEGACSIEFKPGKESRLFFNKNKSYINKNIDAINNIFKEINSFTQLSVKFFKNGYLISDLEKDNNLISLSFIVEYYNARSNKNEDSIYANKVISLFSKLLFLVIETENNNDFEVKKNAKKNFYKDFGEAPNDNLNDLQIFAAKVRKGQPRFRKNLLKKYNYECVISKCEVKEVLEAAHIVSHADSGNNHTSNGLLLRSDIHSLFDSNKIKINPNNFIVEVNSILKNSKYWKYNGMIINKDINGKYPSKKYLRIKYEED